MHDTNSRTKAEANMIAYRERQNNFNILKNGLIKKYVEEDLDLEDRQQESIFKITDTDKGDYTFSSGYFHACTGFGKTYLMIALAEGYRTEKTDKKIIILEENTKVLEQVKRDFIDKSTFNDSDIGAFYGEEKTIDTSIIVCTYASMEKMLKRIGKENIGMVLCDEAHHILSENRQRVAGEFNNCCLYGFTATPDFNESKSCAQVFGELIDSVTLAQGINEGLLCSVKNGLMVSRIPVDLTACRSTTGDYDDKKLMTEIEKASHTKGIREALAEFYLNATDEDLGKIKGKTTLINVPNQKEANKLAEVFNDMAGSVIAKAYHTNSDDKPLIEFNDGTIPVLIQVNRLSEGYNNPEIELCINYPTASFIRETQCSGRALRANKNNPQKMALVLDIVFKKENGADVYEEVARNGQVLFKDVINDVRILAPDYQLHTLSKQYKTKNNDKDSIMDDMLFDVITDYEDLFKLAIDHNENLKNMLPARDKLATDILKSQFISWRLEKNGKNIGNQRRKASIWDELQQDEKQTILIKVQSGANVVFVLPKDNIPVFTQWLEKKDIIVLEKEEAIREKLETDILKSQFASWHLEKDGKIIGSLKTKIAIWDNLQKNENQTILIKVQCGTRVAFVLPKDNIPIFKQLMAKNGIIASEKEENLREKLETDIGKKQFIQNWRLEKNGQFISNQKTKASIWDELQQDENQAILIKVQSGVNVAYVLPKDNIPALKQWLVKKGIIVLEKEENIRDKLETDIVKKQFISWRLEKDGKIIGKQKMKVDIWNELEKDEKQTILIKVQSGSQTPYVLPKDNISAFKQLMAKQGIIVSEKEETLREKLETDTVRTQFTQSWRLKKDGHIIGDQKTKASIWDELEKDEKQTILVKVQSGANVVFVLPKDNIPAFTQWLAKKGIIVLEKEETTREKLKTDIVKMQFAHSWQLKKNGEIVSYKAKLSIWNDLQNDENQTILIKVQSGSKVAFVLPKENIPLFKQWLAKKDIEAYSPFDRLYELQEKAILSETKEEKNQYLIEGKQLFEQLNPEIKKQNICPACLKKITEEHQ